MSGKVSAAFRARGHEAYSCDLRPTLGDPRFHHQGDVLPWLNWGWDIIIGFPPCTFLCNSGVHLLSREKGRVTKMKSAAQFFKQILEADCPRICVENSIMHRYAREAIGARQTQIIQPWQFGHKVQKQTCLWLKQLPPPSSDSQRL